MGLIIITDAMEDTLEDMEDTVDTEDTNIMERDLLSLNIMNWNHHLSREMLLLNHTEGTVDMEAMDMDIEDMDIDLEDMDINAMERDLWMNHHLSKDMLLLNLSTVIINDVMKDTNWLNMIT